MEQSRKHLNPDELQVTSFVTMLDADHEQLDGGMEALMKGSQWYNTCISGLSPGTVGCDGTYSFDQTANNC